MLEGTWQDRYMVYVEEFSDAEGELEAMETLIGDTGKVGEAAVKCLERMTSDDMIDTVGVVLLLIEVRDMGMQQNE